MDTRNGSGASYQESKMKVTITITGNTFLAKESIKAAGWKWNSHQKCWTKEVDAAEVVAAMNGTATEKFDFAKSVCGNKKGCIITQMNIVTGNIVTVWESKTYAEFAAAAIAKENRVSPAQDRFNRAWGEGRYGSISDPDYL
jgi:hypothetical protein